MMFCWSDRARYGEAVRQHQASLETIVDLAFENIDNTCPFNLTHHPALTVPCGVADGCPIGMMLITRPFAEATLYAAAAAYEHTSTNRQR